MNTLHEKSSCCGGIVRRYGGRRRQCGVCRKTWRSWQRSRGRKKKRLSMLPALRYLRGGTAPTRILQPSVIRFVSTTSWPIVPIEESLIAVADAFRQWIEGRLLNVYLITVRPVQDSWAIITPPHFAEGRESWAEWQTAFARLSPEILGSIQALVCDGHPGLIATAKRHGWLIQRCNFHIIAKLQGRRSRWRWSRHRAAGEHLFSLVRIVLTSTSSGELQTALKGLRTIGAATTSPQLRVYLSGFLTHYRDHRTYLAHPELSLPRTTNTAESLIAGIRSLARKAHGFRTQRSFKLWITAFLKYKKKMRCNGASLKNQPNKIL